MTTWIDGQGSDAAGSSNGSQLLEACSSGQSSGQSSGRHNLVICSNPCVSASPRGWLLAEAMSKCSCPRASAAALAVDAVFTMPVTWCRNRQQRTPRTWWKAVTRRPRCGQRALLLRARLRRGPKPLRRGGTPRWWPPLPRRWRA